MWTGTMLGLVRGLICTSPGFVRQRWTLNFTSWSYMSPNDASSFNVHSPYLTAHSYVFLIEGR